eukprot:1161635-Pelagomonas_calceolata.AAC.16
MADPPSKTATCSAATSPRHNHDETPICSCCSLQTPDPHSAPHARQSTAVQPLRTSDAPLASVLVAAAAALLGVHLPGDRAKATVSMRATLTLCCSAGYMLADNAR